VSQNLLTRLLPGVLVCAALAGVAIVLSDWFKAQQIILSPLLLVILLGMTWRTVAALPGPFTPGIQFAQKPILRLAVAGLGFRLSLQQIVATGAPALGIIVIGTFSALAFGWWLAKRMGIPEKLGILLAVGTSICGASAVVAADSVVRSEKGEAGVSLGIITLLGTLGIVIYPLIGHMLGLSPFAYGVWDGASLHEMAQVVAAGDAYGEQAVEVATVTKLARIALLAPIVFLIAWYVNRVAAGTPELDEAGQPKVSPVPWFLVLFVVFAGFNSLGVLPETARGVLLTADVWLLTIGMAGVGLQSGLREIRSAGMKPVAAGLIQWVFLAGLTLGLALLL
jgi:uncharacterized integral membrane protein (TIGR00698 family)